MKAFLTIKTTAMLWKNAPRLYSIYMQCVKLLLHRSLEQESKAEWKKTFFNKNLQYVSAAEFDLAETIRFVSQRFVLMNVRILVL